MTLSDAIALLRELYEHERKYRMDREGLVNRANNPKYPSGQWDRISAALDDVIVSTQSEIKHTLNIIQRFPSNHDRHFKKLKEFNDENCYEESVFIMTKFPEGETEEDKQLSKIISIITDELERIGLTARIAKGAKYHEWLWDEVEIHLLGCARGIAIVEDKYKPELNPNVAMEWGWMRAMGRRVLFLMEETFSHGRADWGGLRSWGFKWEAPQTGINQAIYEFFKE